MIRRTIQALLLLVLAGSSACGNDASTTDAATSTCGSVGSACGAGCPSDLECVDNTCVRVRGECGGFAGDECPETLTCTYPTGNSGGLCMTPEEKTCVCTRAPGTLGDC